MAHRDVKEDNPRARPVEPTESCADFGLANTGILAGPLARECLAEDLGQERDFQVALVFWDG